MKLIYYVLLLGLCFNFNSKINAQNSSILSLDSLIHMAEKGIENSDYVSAANYYYNALKIADNQKNLNQSCKILIGLSKIYLQSENNTSLKSTVSLAQSSCQSCESKLLQARYYLVKGVAAGKFNNLDSAVVFFKKSAAIYLTIGDTTQSANAISKVGNILELEEKYEQALPYYLKYYKVAQTQNNDFYKLTSAIYLTGNYLYLHQAQMANKYNLEARDLAIKTHNNYELSVTMEYNALIHADKKQYQAAYNAMKDYVEYYRDTLLSTERIKEINDLKLKYENASKEVLLEKQKREISLQNSRIIGTSVVLFLLVIGLFFTFWIIRKLRKANIEKEILIKETHHRVKNNLQILSSLLNLNSKSITDIDAIHSMKEGENRVIAMSTIHEKLYMSGSLVSIEMNEYIQNLGEKLLETFGYNSEQLEINYDIRPLNLDVNTAIPLSLIINELITNSLKYAFTLGQKTILNISLFVDVKQQLCLNVADNGKVDFSDISKGSKFGTNLIAVLSKKLHGKIEVSTENGYSTQIVFKKFQVVEI